MKKLSAQFKFSPGTGPKWVLTLGLVYFAVMFVENMLIPCMQVDEATIGTCAVVIFNYFKNLFSDFDAVRAHCPQLPLVYTSYTGFFKAYTAAPFVWFFGPRSLCVVRMQYLFWGLGGLYSMYYVLRRGFGPWPAALAAALLATDTFFIRCMISAVLRDEMLMNAMFWMSLLCLFHAFDGGRFRIVWLFFGGLIIGLALWAKFIFAGYILGFAVCLVFIGRESRQTALSLFFSSWQRVVLFFSGLTIGFAPMIYYNIKSGFPVLDMFSGLLMPVTHARTNWDNSDVVLNFLTRLWNLFDLVRSEMLMAGVYVYNIVHVTPDLVQFGVFCFACFWLMRGLIKSHGRFFDAIGPRSMLKAMVAMSAVLIVGTCVVPGQYSSNHVVIVLPFVKILMALSLLSLCTGHFPGLRKALVALLLCLSVGVQVLNIVYFNRVARDGHGMNEYFYPRQMEVLRGIEGSDIDCLVDATDTWSNVWNFFTKGRVVTIGYVDFRRQNPDLDEDLCIELFFDRFLLCRPRYLYLSQVIHSDSLESGEFIFKFPAMLSGAGATGRVVKEIKSPEDGRVMFCLYEVVRPAAKDL